MKAFDRDYQLLSEMYRDEYYPDFLVDKVRDELRKVIDLLESGETDTEADIRGTMPTGSIGRYRIRTAASLAFLPAGEMGTIPFTLATMQRGKSAPFMCASLTLKSAIESRSKERSL